MGESGIRMADSARTIFLMRHGEKPHGKHLGVDIDGNENCHSLVPKGWQRAGALVHLFVSDDRGFARVHDLFAPLYLDHDGKPAADIDKRRTHQTIQPLAKLLGTEVHSPYVVDEAECLGKRLAKKRSGVSLVCWEHDKIPNIAAGIAPDVDVPQHWPKDRFDVIWCFARGPSTTSFAFTQLPQMLLHGDQGTVIAP